MEAKELRIGNWIYDSDEAHHYFQVEEIRKEKGFNGLTVVYRNGSFRVAEPEPIQLTEEILLKCGFEKLKGKNNENTFMNADLNFGNPVLKLTDYTMLCTNGGYEYLFLDGFRLPCKYLHQLQNLYFALTGQELTINL